MFCNDRDFYYQKLGEADKGTDDALLDWCQYVLAGILVEVTKVNKLLDFKYLYKNILVPTIEHGIDRGYLNSTEAKILRIGIKEQVFKAGDLEKAMEALTPRQRTHQIMKMKEAGFIRPIKEKSRSYHVSFLNNFLMRSLIQTMEKEDFIPPIDK